MPTATEPAPEKVETIEAAPTAIATELKKSADAAIEAVSDGGFDDQGFIDSMQAAIDKDAGLTKPEPAPVPAAPVVTPEATAKAAELAAKQVELSKLQEAAGDIPGELLGEKPKEQVKAPDEAAAAAERQKFIEEQTKGMTPKAAERFRKIEGRAWEAEQKTRKIEQDQVASSAELKKQVAELTAKLSEPKPDETEKLRKQIDELQEVVTKGKLLEHPAFKRAYDEPIASELEEMKKLVAADNGEELSQIAMLPDSKKRKERIKELVDGLDDLDRLKVLDSIKNVDKLNASKAKELANWKENRVQLEAKELEKQQSEQAQVQAALANQQKVAWSKGVEAVTSSDRGLEVFRKLDGDDAWNAKVDARLAAVQKSLTGEIPGERIVEMAARALAAEEYRKMFLAQRILVQRQAEELALLKQAQPDVSGDGSDGGPVDDTRDYLTAAIEGSVKAGALRQ